MMIPVILFLGMNPQELLLFQIVQTILDYGLVYLLLFVVLKKINPQSYKVSKLLITALCIEGVYVAASLLWYFFVHYGIGGFFIELIFLLLVPYLVIYLLYTPTSDVLKKASKGEGGRPLNQERYLSTGKSFLLYLLSVIPAFIISCTLTSVFFNLFGIYNVFILS